MVSGNRHIDSDLSRLLRRWRVSPRPSPGFRHEVWRRIAALRPGRKRAPVAPAKPPLRGQH